MQFIEFKEIETSKIKRPSWSLRSEPYVDPNFVASVREGLIEPVIVRESENGYYELVCGNRRLIAAGEAGLDRVSCRVMKLTDLEAWSMMFQENHHREEAPGMDTAASILYATENFGLSQKRLAKLLHISEVTVSNLLRILRHPLLFQKVKSGEHSIQSALELLSRMPAKDRNPEEYANWESFVNKTSGMSVGKIRELARTKLTHSSKVHLCKGCGSQLELNSTQRFDLCNACSDKILEYIRKGQKT